MDNGTLPEEAIDFLSPAEAIAQRPASRLARSTIHVMAGGLLAAALWASLAQVEEIVYAHGKISSVERTVVIQPLETSIIREIHVREGQKISKGQPLITLDPTFSGADLADGESRVKALVSQKRRVEAELAEQPFIAQGPEDATQAGLYQERQHNHDARLRSYEAQMQKAKAELETARQSVELLSKRMKTMREVEAMEQELYQQQVGSRLRYLGSQDQRLSVEHDYSSATHRIQELAHTINSAEADRDAFLQEWRQKLTEEMVTVNRDLDQAREATEKASLRHALSVIVSPTDGVVLEVAKRSVSSVVREAEQLVTIMPLDVPLEVEAKIDSADIGQVNLGAQARIKVDTFPYQKFGTLPATVRVISMDSFARDSASGQKADGPASYFMTHLELGKGQLGNSESPAILMPGMSVTAEIVIGHRSVMSYLLRPLAGNVDNALHEP
ncbi:MAG TPA: HlyD family type I secretion periplasmic adaptor subunit [Candidatus Sulfotelmatobacter sp.]|jgi:HlyD family secretion protein|nr:HlyD family type I secretion periplasmic adaptor subunit [Candidatus Sulfotelmatobacter sp.]